MLDVTSSAEEIVDLWGYASEIVDTNYPDADDWDWRVMFIYESRDGRFQHLNIPVPVNNTYLSVVADKPNRKILGHYVLALQAEHPDWKSQSSPAAANAECHTHVPSETSCPKCGYSPGQPGDV
jgi:hypothetical protein